MKVEVFIILRPNGKRILINTNQIAAIIEQDDYTYIVTSAGEKFETTDSFDSLISKLVEE